jgi:hypothetical protein
MMRVARVPRRANVVVGRARLLANENVPGPVVRALREPGHVLLRIRWSDPVVDNAFAVSTLTSREDWSGVFAVIEHDHVRIRALPDSSTS